MAEISGFVLTSVLTRPVFGLISGDFTYEKRRGGNRTRDYFPPVTVYLQLVNLQPILSPSRPLPRTASGSDVHKVEASIDDRIF